MAFTKVVGAGIHTLSNITSHNINSSGIITATKFVGPIEGDITAVDATFTGNVSIAKTLTYEDVKNVDSVGIGTFRQGVFIPDTKELKIGNTASSPDLKIYSDGTNAIQYSQDTNLYIKGKSVYIQTNNNEASAYFYRNGAVELYYDGSAQPKFETTNTGAKVTGTLAGASEVGIQSGGVQIGAGITQLNFIGLGNTFAVNGTTLDVSISGNTGAGGTWSVYTAGIATTKSVGVNTNNLDDNDLVGVGNSFQGLYISNGMMITDNTLSGNHYIGTAFNGLMAGPVTIDGTLTVEGNYVVV